MSSTILIVGLLLFVVVFIFVYTTYMRKKYITFTEEVCAQIDAMLFHELTEEITLEDETLSSKIQAKLNKLYNATRAMHQDGIQQKQEIQEMVSDISHQLKTPLSNIMMYYDTLINYDLPKDKEKECQRIMQSQVAKMDFLITSLIKMSRLESNLINLQKEKVNVHECLNETIETISSKAKDKNINISISCKNPFYLLCDYKWTMEALFNIVENAVKYTPINGSIDILVERLEMYTKISISDTGIGISSQHINDVFKRFFRERKVYKEDGVGIGLYLTRRIIMQQEGYIKVNSKEGVGSTFSVYLLHNNL
ncbi:MAG: sensor histidine kinase [Coprobacillaceae bacterium]